MAVTKRGPSAQAQHEDVHSKLDPRPRLSGQLRAPGALHPGETTARTNWRGGWTSPPHGEKPLPRIESRPSRSQPVTLPKERQTEGEIKT